jgi:undecaprenyl-diphosphatase
MNESLSAALLGIVQGLTEFLPVSSSGHLVLFEHYLPIQGDPVAFDLVLHLGTLLPVLLVYRQDLLGIVRDLAGGEEPLMSRPGVRLLLLMVAGTIPTGLIGVLFKDTFESLFSAQLYVGIAFAVTGLVLWLTRYIPTGTETEQTLSWWKGVLVGIVQGLAITPGISRSGSTIAAGMLLGIERESAARLSFLLSIPAILGAFILKSRDLESWDVSIMPMAVGFIAAALSGYLALRVLLLIVKKGDFSWFALYLWPLSIFAIASALAG